MISISIVIPCYNVEKYLDRCVYSILSNDCLNTEIILIDDGSKDRTSEICDKFSDTYDNIKVVHKENGGLPSARNVGLEIATGDYVLFIDSDDSVNDNYLKCIRDKLGESDFDCIIFGHKYYDNGKFIRDCKPLDNYMYNNTLDIIKGFYPKFMGTDKESFENWQKYGTGIRDKSEMAAVWKYVYKNKIIKDHNLRYRNVHMIEDMVWNIEYLEHCNTFATIDEALYNYYSSDTGILRSGANLDKMLIYKNAGIYYRERVRMEILKTYGWDVIDSYEPSYVLTIFELMNAKSNSNNVIQDYRSIYEYIKEEHVQLAIKHISLGRKIKFAIPMLFLKMRLYYFLYLVFILLKKLNIRIAL